MARTSTNIDSYTYMPQLTINSRDMYTRCVLYGREYRVYRNHIVLSRDDYFRNEYLRRCHVYEINYTTDECLVDPREVQEAEALWQRDRQIMNCHLYEPQDCMTGVCNNATQYNAVYATKVFNDKVIVGIDRCADEEKPKNNNKVSKHALNIKKLYWARRLKDKEIKL